MHVASKYPPAPLNVNKTRQTPLRGCWHTVTYFFDTLFVHESYTEEDYLSRSILFGRERGVMIRVCLARSREQLKTSDIILVIAGGQISGGPEPRRNDGDIVSNMFFQD